MERSDFGKSWHYYPVAAEKVIETRAVLFFLLWSLWLAFEYVAFGPFSYVRIWDNGDSFLPAKMGLAHKIWESGFSYWDPLAMSGIDALAPSMTTELDNLLFMAMPGWLAYGFCTWLQRFFACYFTYRLLNETLKLNVTPSVLAGLAYSFFNQFWLNDYGGFTLFDGLSLPGLPLVLYSLGRIIAKESYWSYLLAAGLGLAFAITSAFYLAAFLVPLIVCWLLFFATGSRTKILTIVAVFGAGWVIGEFPVLWASWKNGQESHRGDWIVTRVDYDALVERFTVAAGILRTNYIFIGLALMGLVFSRGRHRQLLIICGTLVLFLGLAIVLPSVTVLFANTSVEFLSGFRFDRVNLAVPFLAIVAGAVGVQLIPKNWQISVSKRTWRLHEIPLQSLFLAAAICLVVWQTLIIKKANLNRLTLGDGFSDLYQNPDLRRIAGAQIKSAPFRVSTVTDHFRFGKLHPAYVWSYGLESVDGYINLFPKRYKKFWAQVVARSLDRDRDYRLMYFGTSRNYLFPPSNGFPALGPPRFVDYYNLELLSLANVRYIISPLIFEDENLVLLPSKVRDEQLSRRGRTFMARFIDIVMGRHPGEPLYIYENKMVFPRFFLVNKVQIFDESAQVLDALGAANYESLRSTAYLKRSEIVGVPIGQLDAKGGEVTLLSYSGDKIILRVSASSPSILITTNNFSPFWQAKVNGVETKVFPVDHTFQGAYVDAGHHEVLLEYKPPYAVDFKDPERSVSSARAQAAVPVAVTDRLESMLVIN